MSEAQRDYQLGTPAGVSRALERWIQAVPILHRLGDRAGEWVALFSIGRVHAESGHPDSALAYFDSALPIERAVGDRAAEAAILLRIAEMQDQVGRPDSALVYAHLVLPIRREIGDRKGEGLTLAYIGLMHRQLDHPDSALAYYFQALPVRREAGDRRGEGVVLNNIGHVYTDTGHPDSALAYHFRSLAIARDVGARFDEGTALHDIGRAYSSLARPDSSLAYYRLALSVELELGDREGEAATLQNMGVEYQVAGRADSALADYHLTLALAGESGFPSVAAMALLNIGAVQVTVGRPDSALEYYQRSLAIQRELGDRRSEGLALTQIGQAESILGRSDSALAYHRQALAIAREVQNREGEGRALASIGLEYGVLGSPDSAEAYYGQALTVQRAIGDRRDESGTVWALGVQQERLGRPDSARVYYRAALASAREVQPDNVGMMLEAIGSTYYRSGSPVPAIAYFDSSAANLAGIAAHTGGESNRVSFAEMQVELYTRWTLAWLAREPEVGRGPSALAALAASERGRSQALLELMRRTSVDAAPGRDLVAEGTGLLESASKSGSAVLSYLVTADTLVLWFAVPGHEVEVRRRAVSQAALAEWVGALRGALGVSGVARGRVALDGGGSPDADDPPSARGVVSALPVSRISFDSVSRLLADLLLPRELDRQAGGVAELVIVPQGVLGLVPFGVLPIDSSGTPLASRYALRYAPSLAVLREAEGRPGISSGPGRAGALGQALIVGNPVMPSRSSLGETFELPRLPGAEAEAANVAEQLGGAALTGVQATEAEVRRRIADAPVVHLATHGYAYATEARARQSFIALAPDPQDDGFLTVGEVLDDPAFTLRADLIVLSACQTGLGDLKQAEGTVGLQRAFLAKGARSVLVSLWSVSDEATALLMKNFYRHWLHDPDEPSKAESLRRAEAAVRKTPGFEAPRYWAAFQLVGAR